MGNTHRAQTISRADVRINQPGTCCLVVLSSYYLLASALLGGIYLLLRHEPISEKKAPKKNVMSNVK